MRSLAARVAALIRVDAVWLANEPIDMRAGTETALARVVRQHHDGRAVGPHRVGHCANLMVLLNELDKGKGYGDAGPTNALLSLLELVASVMKARVDYDAGLDAQRDRLIRGGEMPIAQRPYPIGFNFRPDGDAVLAPRHPLR